ncbi:MAG TPA: type 1 glutamine amidotransferase domain-containing protein [Nostocaceae cyanobacterium]|nr:type 1 glutamine amidotransferase domain-containing protein [Nostocaceae cyanobacterium]
MLSEWGYWGEELVGPLETFEKSQYTFDFATPYGKRPIAIGVSMDPTFVDPPLGKPVVSEEMAAKVKEIDAATGPRGDIFKDCKNIHEWIPERPYWSSPTFIRELEEYNNKLEEVKPQLLAYDALLIVGGSGPMVDLVNNQRVHDIILTFYRANKPVGAECYGVACLAFARDMNERISIIKGKNVTGHCLEYDYKDNTGFMPGNQRYFEEGQDPTKSDLGSINFGPPFYPLEYILRDATAPDGQYHGNFGKPTSVIVDYPFITGRSTPDSYLTGEKMVEVLEQGLTRYGW